MKVILSPHSDHDSGEIRSCKVMLGFPFVDQEAFGCEDFALPLPKVRRIPRQQKQGKPTPYTSLLISPGTAVPVIRVKPAKNHSLIVPIESVVVLVVNLG